jgi:NitT/TauT family transport system ATP-binding protein
MNTEPNQANPNPAAEPNAGSAPTATVQATPQPTPVAVAKALPPVVEFRNVSKMYAGAKPFTAVKNVTFKIEDHPIQGEFICILGPSGCGKSTILRLIAGLAPQYPASSGEVLLFGKPVGPASSDRGMVFQDYTSFDHLRVWENIAFGLQCQGIAASECRERALTWIGKVGLSPSKDADKFPHQLSGGMRQRVAIARSLILNPRIMLMDEPFGALDPATRLAMQDLLIALWSEQKSTVFFITHAIDEAVYLADKILIMTPAPGTILQETVMTRAREPARVMQRRPEFQDQVFALREIMEKLEQPK